MMYLCGIYNIRVYLLVFVLHLYLYFILGAEEKRKEVIINRQELCHLLFRTVKVTNNCPVEVLIELYISLSKCIALYSKVWDRTKLPDVSTRYIGNT